MIMYTKDKETAISFDKLSSHPSQKKNSGEKSGQTDCVLTEIPTGNIQIKFRRSIAKKTTLREDCKTEDIPEID
jgi:hypothetical protein